MLKIEKKTTGLVAQKFFRKSKTSSVSSTHAFPWYGGSTQIDFRIKDYAFFKKGDGFKFMNNEEERLLNFYGQTYNFDKI